MESVLNMAFLDKFVSEEDCIKQKSKIEAFKNLTEGNLAALDPLVGDTACQIRAIKIADIYSKVSALGLSSLSNQEEEFIILSQMLTNSKEEIRDEKGYIIKKKMNYKKLGDKISKNKGYQLIRDSQRRLAHLSIQSLQEMALEIGDEQIIKALSYVLIDNEESCFRRPICATFPSMKLILNYAIKKDYGLLVEIASSEDICLGKIKLFYKVINNTFTLVDSHQISPNTPLIVIKGYSDAPEIELSTLQNCFSDLGVINILLANFAAHPQFISTQRNADVPYEAMNLAALSQEKNKYTQFASQYGCSLENKKLFLADHIFTTTMNNISFA